MPEHFHTLMTEPGHGTPSTVMQVLKQRLACSLRHEHECSTTIQHVWQERFYDSNVWSAQKEREKLRYTHQNPVKRVTEPQEWKWSSFCSYPYQEPGLVRINVREWHPQTQERVRRREGVVPALSPKTRKNPSLHSG